MAILSPNGFDAKGLDYCIGTYQGQPFVKGLSRNQSVPRVAVDQRQSARSSGVKWTDREQFDVGLDQMCCDVEVIWQPKLTEGRLEVDLLDAGYTCTHTVCWIAEQRTDRRAYLAGSKQSKQDCIGIEQISHIQPSQSKVREVSATPISSARSNPEIGCSLDQTSNGTGASASSFNDYWSSSAPKKLAREGFDKPFPVAATSLNTSLPLRAMTTSSPRSARSISSESLALAYATFMTVFMMPIYQNWVSWSINLVQHRLAGAGA